MAYFRLAFSTISRSVTLIQSDAVMMVGMLTIQIQGKAQLTPFHVNQRN
jgi:hypothetical protein